jgi:hypothetical protein
VGVSSEGKTGEELISHKKVSLLLRTQACIHISHSDLRKRGGVSKIGRLWQNAAEAANARSVTRRFLQSISFKAPSDFGVPPLSNNRQGSAREKTVQTLVHTQRLCWAMQVMGARPPKTGCRMVDSSGMLRWGASTFTPLNSVGVAEADM